MGFQLEGIHDTSLNTEAKCQKCWGSARNNLCRSELEGVVKLAWDTARTRYNWTCHMSLGISSEELVSNDHSLLSILRDIRCQDISEAIKTELEQGCDETPRQTSILPFPLRETQVKHHNYYDVQSHWTSESGTVTNWEMVCWTEHIPATRQHLCWEAWKLKLF